MTQPQYYWFRHVQVSYIRFSAILNEYVCDFCLIPCTCATYCIDRGCGFSISFIVLYHISYLFFYMNRNHKGLNSKIFSSTRSKILILQNEIFCIRIENDPKPLHRLMHVSVWFSSLIDYLGTTPYKQVTCAYHHFRATFV